MVTSSFLGFCFELSCPGTCHWDLNPITCIVCGTPLLGEDACNIVLALFDFWMLLQFLKKEDISGETERNDGFL